MMRKGIIMGLLLLTLTACNPPVQCIDGELYTDENNDGIFVKETHDLGGKTPVECANKDTPNAE
jgi:hypothetical protein